MQAPQLDDLTQTGRDFLGMVLQFLHTAADAIGDLIAYGIRMILPAVNIPDSLASTIGLLALVSLLLGLSEFAKKAVWIVVIVGWILVVVRITLIAWNT